MRGLACARPEPTNMPYANSQFMCFTSLPPRNNLNPGARSSADAKRIVADAEPITRIGQADVLRICLSACSLFFPAHGRCRRQSAARDDQERRSRLADWRGHATSFLRRSVAGLRQGRRRNHIALNRELETVCLPLWAQAGAIESFVDWTGSHAAARFRKP